jgi:uncharacterized protein YxjI
MQSFAITQKILAVGATYEVKARGSDEVINLIKGRILTITPKLEMKTGEKGAITHVLKGNFWRTRFVISTSEQTEIGVIQFPFVAFFKRFSLITGGRTYQAKGSITAWHFNCADESGKAIFSISKEFAFRDKFTVDVDESMPKEVGILAAIAVDQKFFQQR